MNIRMHQVDESQDSEALIKYRVIFSSLAWDLIRAQRGFGVEK